MRTQTYFKYISIILLVTVIVAGFTFQYPFLNSIKQFLKNQKTEYAQVKIYVHTDKDIYQAGEHIWFRVYLVSAGNHNPDTTENIAYTELISSENNVFQTKILNLDKGIYQGNFYLSDTITAGKYQLRAYTNWMRNFDAALIFTKQIHIENKQLLFTPDEIKEAKRNKRKTKRLTRRYKMSFYPEGGQIVHGIRSTVGFYISDELGHPVKCSGKIIERRGEEITRFETTIHGLGKFDITPSKNESYCAILTSGIAKGEKFSLPDIQEQGFTLKIKAKNDSIEASVRNNILPGERNENFVILVHVRNKLVYLEKRSVGKKASNFRFSKKEVPGGIIHFTVFHRNRPVCERLWFNDQYSTMKISLLPEQSTKDSAGFVLKTMYNDEPVKASLSLSTLSAESEQNKCLTQSGIVHYMYLFSDVYTPVHLSNTFKDTLFNNENLANTFLLTKQWLRFSWQDMTSEFVMKYEKEQGIDLSGRITKYFFDIPVKNASVTMTILDEYNEEFKTKTGEKGRFEFNDLEYYDTVDVLIKARTSSGRKNVLILMDESDYMEIEDENRELYDYSIEEMKNRKKAYIKDTIQEEDDGRFRIYSSADNVVHFEQHMTTFSSPLEAMKGRVAGVHITGSGMDTRARIRGVNSLFLSQDPLYLIDGIPVDVQAVNAMSVNDVEKIEVLKNASKTSMFGSRGANGVIAVYTKRGFFMKRGEIQFQMLGYSSVREFKKSGLTSNSKVPKTILWKGNIKTNESGEAIIHLPKNDSKDYFIAIEGLSENGIPGQKYCSSNELTD
jgi:TonB-dependent SusC/RagA subfamily outer membrane receptor